MHRPVRPTDRDIAELLNMLAKAAAGSPFWVYVIRDPFSGDPLYVGQTKDPARQAKRHILAAGSAERRPSQRSRVRLRAILDQCRVPVFELVEGAATRLAALAAQMRWVRRFRAEGFDVEAPGSEHGRNGGCEAGGFGSTGIPMVRVWDLTLEEADGDRVAIWIACRACGTEVEIPLGRAIARSSPGVKLRAMREALRCPGCGARGVLRLVPPLAPGDDDERSATTMMSVPRCG